MIQELGFETSVKSLFESKEIFPLNSKSTNWRMNLELNSEVEVRENADDNQKNRNDDEKKPVWKSAIVKKVDKQARTVDVEIVSGNTSSRKTVRSENSKLKSMLPFGNLLYLHWL